ncbi:MAG TPA: sigma-70 family RNA polymerase sigma factor [Polyangiaceae bacterium]|nr:sigma-70 family RNA polymerase sigma factor [Polyangiaceae bacterium]
MRAPSEAYASAGITERPIEESHEDSLERIYEEHFSFVWRSLRAFGVQPALLDDATQEVFLVVHRRGKDFERRSSMRTWLFGIAHRVAANFRRSAKRRPTQPLAGELLSEHPSPEQHAQRAETALFVERFLNGTSEEQRDVFVACMLEEMSVPEAAEALGVNVNTLSSRLRTVRTKFAAALAKREPKR